MNLSKTAFRILRVAAFVLAAFILMPANDADAQMKIGYVDLQQALNEVEDGKKAKARLKKEFDKKQKELDKRQNELKKKKEALEEKAKGGVPLSDQGKQALQGEVMRFQKEMYDLQQTYIKLQGELSQAEAKETKKIFDKMAKIIDKIGADGSYDMILERTESSILYAKDGMNLTKELVKRYNSGK